MKKLLFLIVGILIGVALLVVVFLFFFNSSVQPPDTTPGTISTGTSTPGSNLPTPGTGTTESLSIRSASGGLIQTKDFLKDPETIKETSNEGYYSLGNHFSENAKAPPYVVQFIDETDFFNVSLFQEPIGESRKAAEQYMMAHLGISQTQMCDLQYMVSTPTWVNEFYSITSLGFSFCPGSVQIPE